MKKIRDIKLSMKLIIVGIIAVLVPMSIVGFITVNASSNALSHAGQEATFQTAQDLAETAGLFLSQEIKFAQTMARNPNVGPTVAATSDTEPDTDTLKALDQYFGHHLKGTGEDYDLFFITNAKGAILADSMGGALRRKQVNVGDRAYFKAVRGGNTVVGNPIVSRASGNAVVTVAVPIMAGTGGFAGIFCSVIRLNTLSSKLTAVKIGTTGYAYMVDSKGVVIAHPNEEFLFKLNLKNAPGMEAVGEMMAAGESGVRRYVFDGQEKVAGFAHIPRAGWSVGVTVNEAELMAPVKKMVLFSLVTGLVALGIMGGFILFAAMGITAPINRTVDGLKDITAGDGDLTRRLTVSGKDEVGILAYRFNGFVDQLHAMISDITQGVDTLSSASDRLAGISRSLSDDAGQASEKTDTATRASREMDSRMTSVSAAMVQSSANVNAVAGAAEEMNATIGEIAMNAENARAISADAVTQVDASFEQMDELGNAAQSIGQVVEAITDISEQVNLLSLNATIEAARAGEAGRGFAVVANEIKELANQTSSASMDIKDKIDHIQTCSTATLGGMKAVSKVITEVNEIVATIAVAVEEQSAAVGEISENISQASSGIQEVSQAVGESSQASQDIAQDMGEVSRASEKMADQSSKIQSSSRDLSGLADQLNTLVGRFKI